MSLLIQQDDFGVAGSVSTQWIQVTSSGFASDGQKASQTVASLNAEAQMTFAPSDPGVVLTSPKIIQYEGDVVMPATLPTGVGSSVRMGLTVMNLASGRSGLGFQIERNAAGASHAMRVVLRGTAAASETLVALNNLPVAPLVAGQTYRLKIDIVIGASTLFVYFYIDGSNVLTSTINLGQFNTGTNRSLTTFLSATYYGGFFTKIDGSLVGYVDRFRVRDIGVNAVLADLWPAYTLTAAPTLTPIALSVEDDSTGDTLPVQPDRPNVPDDQWQHNEFRPDGGHVVTHARGSRSRTRWPMVWGVVSSTDHDSITAFHANMTGRKKAFTWNDPETATAIKLRFVAPLNARQIARGSTGGARIYSLSTAVEEVFA